MACKYTYNLSVFTNEDDISYYLLGLFITDGNVFIDKRNANWRRISSGLTSIDYDLLFSIKELVCPALPIKKKNNSNCFRLRFSNKEIGDWLIKNECIPNKTKVVKFPNVPQKYLPDFIRGLIDGDGSIGFYAGGRKSSIRFDSASLSLITSLMNVLKEIGINSSITETKWITPIINGRQTKSTTQMYRLVFNGLTAYKLLKFMYKNDRLSLLRKKNIANKIYNYIERNKFSEEDLLKMDRLPAKKWPSNNELYDLMIKHKGSLVNAGAEINTAGWTLSSRLQKIGIYDIIRKLYPYCPSNNLH